MMEHVEKALPEIPVRYLGTVYLVKASFAVLAKYQRATGKNPLDFQIFQNCTPIDYATLLWAMLSTEDPSIQYEDVEKNLGVDSIRTCVELISALLIAAQPPRADDEDDEKKTTDPTVIRQVA